MIGKWNQPSAAWRSLAGFLPNFRGHIPRPLPQTLTLCRHIGQAGHIVHPCAQDLFTAVCDTLLDSLKLLIKPFRSLLKDAPDLPLRRWFAIRIQITRVVDEIYLSSAELLG